MEMRPVGSLCKQGHVLDERNSVTAYDGRRCRACRLKASYEWKQRNKDYLAAERERRRHPKSEYRMRSGLPRRLLETLWLEGGWWTDDGLALRLNADPEHVSRTLYRLHTVGLLESRRVLLAAYLRGLDQRTEWKAISEPTQLVLDFTD